MTSRRKFVQTMALLAAGASALPAQIEAYHALYDANTPSEGEFNDETILVRDILFGFAGEPRDEAHDIRFQSGEKILIQLALNHRATLRWVATPEQPLIVQRSTFQWRVSPSAPDWAGSIHYTAPDLRIHRVPFYGSMGSLVEAERQHDHQWQT